MQFLKELISRLSDERNNRTLSSVVLIIAIIGTAVSLPSIFRYVGGWFGSIQVIAYDNTGSLAIKNNLNQDIFLLSISTNYQYSAQQQNVPLHSKQLFEIIPSQSIRNIEFPGPGPTGAFVVKKENWDKVLRKALSSEDCYGRLIYNDNHPQFKHLLSGYLENQQELGKAEVEIVIKYTLNNKEKDFSIPGYLLLLDNGSCG